MCVENFTFLRERERERERKREGSERERGSEGGRERKQIKETYLKDISRRLRVYENRIEANIWTQEGCEWGIKKAPQYGTS